MVLLCLMLAQSYFYAKIKLMNLKFAKIFGLVILILMMAFLGLKIFDFKNEDDSAAIISLPTKKPAAEVPITFTLGGDAMLGRAVAYAFDNDVTQAFTNLGENYFGKVDLGMINLEGPISTENITPNPSPDIMLFNFPRNSIDALKYLKINAASLANNHSQNQGLAGLTTTRQLLSEAQITAIGSQTAFDENSIAHFQGGVKGREKLAVLTINCLETQTNITSNIKAEKAAGNFVLVFPHWGSEYQTTHNSHQETLAHAWIDAGADLIIGSHPHVIQDAEIYQNKPIFYSLGNLVFDQPFSVATQRGLILKGEITSKEIKITIIPTKISKNQVSLLDGTEKDATLEKFQSVLGPENFQADTLNIRY